MKDEECEKLLKVRDQIGEELEDLTASLFEVKYKILILRFFLNDWSEFWMVIIVDFSCTFWRKFCSISCEKGFALLELFFPCRQHTNFEILCSEKIAK